jgi:hypothetical protein
MRDRLLSLGNLCIVPAIVIVLLLLAAPHRAWAGDGGECVPRVAPELDPGMLSGGLALASAGGLLLLERFRRRR